jgi:hypothetical protein
LSINDLTKTDSLEESEGGSSAVQLLVVSSVSDANPARAPPATQALTEEVLAPILEEALRLWTASGIAADAVARLANLSVQVADLRDGELGEANGFTITLDDNAAGYGWFVDPTPADSSEYSVAADNSRSAADADSPAFGRMDLLTVLLHEMGHVLGFDHDCGLPVMADQLASGERALLDRTSVVAGSGGSVPGALQENPAGTLAAEVGDVGPITFRIFDNNSNATPDVEVTGAATGDGIYDDIATIIGSASDLDFIVLDIADTTRWDVTGANAGSVTVDGFSAIVFSSIENLNGGAANDTFVFDTAGTLSGLVDGGSGGTDGLAFAPGPYALMEPTLTDTQSGSVTLDARTVAYSGMDEIAALGTVDAFVLNLPSDNAKLFTLGAAAGNAGYLTLTADGGSFAATFEVPTASLTINLGSAGKLRAQCPGCGLRRASGRQRFRDRRPDHDQREDGHEGLHRERNGGRRSLHAERDCHDAAHDQWRRWPRYSHGSLRVGRNVDGYESDCGSRYRHVEQCRAGAQHCCAEHGLHGLLGCGVDDHRDYGHSYIVVSQRECVYAVPAPRACFACKATAAASTSPFLHRPAHLLQWLSISAAAAIHSRSTRSVRHLTRPSPSTAAAARTRSS